MRRITGIWAQRFEATGLTAEQQRQAYLAVLVRMVEASTLRERAELAYRMVEPMTYVPVETVEMLYEGGVRIVDRTYRPARIEAIGWCNTESPKHQRQPRCHAQWAFNRAQNRSIAEQNQGEGEKTKVLGEYLLRTQHIVMHDDYFTNAYVLAHEVMHALDHHFGAGLDPRVASGSQRAFRRGVRRNHRRIDELEWSRRLPWDDEWEGEMEPIGSCTAFGGCPRDHYKISRHELFAEYGAGLAVRERHRSDEILAEVGAKMGRHSVLGIAVLLDAKLDGSLTEMAAKELLPRWPFLVIHHPSRWIRSGHETR